MRGFAWLAHRQAQEAIKHGRLEEALRVLSQADAQGRRGHASLLTQLGRAFAERGENALRLDDAETAWRDLLLAEQLQAPAKAAAQLRQALTRLGTAEVRALLQAGEPARAEDAAGRLRERQARPPELQVLEEAARGWQAARQVGLRGDFAAALEALDRVRRLVRGVPVLERERADLEQRRQKFADLLGRLHEATEAGRWRDVIEVAEEVLAVAPQHAEALKARGRAWKAVEPVTVAMGAPPEAPAAPASPDGPPQRFLLWIDGVGGYLVCLGSRVNFGQALPEATVDVPLVADVSRIHASLTRDGEGYVLESSRVIQVNGQSTTRALLRPNDRVTLGASCQFQFRQPAPASATARLDLVSGHRLPLGVDGVVLMAETLLLGAGEQVHVTIPDLKTPVVFFRCKDGLGLRHAGKYVIDGKKGPERTLLGPRAHVSGDDFAFAVEPVGARLR
jgi:tetratricopeptide (TPR) repeat protein